MLQRKGVSEDDAENSSKKSLMQIALTSENFEKIANIDKDFEDYMTNVRGSDVVAAREESMRNDEFDLALVKPRKDYSAVPAVAKRINVAEKKEHTKGSGWMTPSLDKNTTGAMEGEPSGSRELDGISNERVQSDRKNGGDAYSSGSECN